MRQLTRYLPMLGMSAAVMVLAAACGSSTKTTVKPPSTVAQATAPSTTGAQAATTAPAATTASTSAQAAGLSGTWSGQYSGVYQGTFTLIWQQSGSTLNGNIKLSSPATTLAIDGQVQGSTIRFGAVGGVTYSGTVSGNSMSGSYQNPTGGGGAWSATKSS